MKAIATALWSGILTFAMVGCPISAHDDDDTSDDGPTVADASAGDCEGDGFEIMAGGEQDADEADAEAASTVDLQVSGTSLLLHFEDLVANCCPSPGADVDVIGDLIEIDFSDVTSDEACGCTCIMDFDLEIVDVVEGDYTVDVYHDGTFLDSFEISV